MPYRNLTKEQMSAVMFEGNLLLSACPGSGKTRTLVSKLFHILDNAEQLSIGKKKVIAITYTNIAADTISERLLSYGVNNNSLWVGTIHSFCLQWIIKPNINKVPRLGTGYVVIDEHEKEAKIIELKEKYDIKSFDSIQTCLNLDYKPIYAVGSAKYYLTIDYHKYLRDSGYIDFDLILNISHRLLKDNFALCTRLAQLIYHLLIDEYQDISEIQYEIFKLIILRKLSIITLVGDKEQAIYTGLGAVVKDKKEIENYFEMDTICEKRLTGCFRSSQRLIDYYKKYQDDKHHIESKSALKDFNSVVHLESNIDKTQLAGYVVRAVETHIKQGIEAKDIVIVCPSWFGVINLSTEIDAMNKCFSINGFLISPIPKNQDNIWLSLIRLMLLKPCMKNYIKRNRLAVELSDNLFDSGSLGYTVNPKVILRAVNSLSIDTNMEIDEWLNLVIDSFCSILSIGMVGDSITKAGKCSLIDATSERIKKYNMNYRASDLHRFFSASNGVKITTCHSTKGDEYEVVICTGLLKGKVPHWNDIIDCGYTHQNYIARRLLYVIASRAKKHLYMISEKGHKTGSGIDYKATEQL
jgi:superfamily I DNA/RNA helicase